MNNEFNGPDCQPEWDRHWPEFRHGEWWCVYESSLLRNPSPAFGIARYIDGDWWTHPLHLETREKANQLLVVKWKVRVIDDSSLYTMPKPIRLPPRGSQPRSRHDDRSSMKILGIDFTSSPSLRKPITCLHCTLDDGALRYVSCEEWSNYKDFEDALAMPGPWIAGIDFPFGQSRRFIKNIGWPRSWAAYVRHAGQFSRENFREALNDYKEKRIRGDKEHRRATDKLAGSLSPQKLYGVPVGLMFFEGAPRLLASGVTIPHLHKGDPQRIAIEAYPGVLVRQFIGRHSYKNDTRKKQTIDQHEARRSLLQALRKEAPQRYGFRIVASDDLCDDPRADHLDALLCAVQAAWAWRQRDNRFGAPETVDRREGWIADPHLSVS